MDLQHEIEQMFRVSESGIEAAKVALDAINDLHIAYCEVFRNEIDNLWGKQDGRYKMLRKFSEAKQKFSTIIQLERKLKKDKAKG